MDRNKIVFVVLLGTFLMCAGLLIWLSTPVHVAAQCGSNPPPESTCVTCHIEEAPVYENGEWHGVHARKDCCANCHGGNCRASDKDLSHQDMNANPLSDIYTNCHSCHPDDYLARAQVFAAELDLQPYSAATPTPVAMGKSMSRPIVILPSPEQSVTVDTSYPMVIGGLTVITLGLLGIITLIIHLRG